MTRPPVGARPTPARAPSAIRTDLAELLHLAGPVVVARVGIMTMGLTDAIVVGRYSAVQLGYHAMGWSLTSIMVVTIVGLLSGVQVMASRAIGEGEPRLAGAALRRGLVYGWWVGLAAMVGLVAIGPAVLKVSGISPALAAGATPPMIALALSLPFFGLSIAAGSWLEGLGRPRPMMLLMWLANMLNLAVDVVLVPGRFGLPALGAVGGACATLSARVLLTVATIAYIARMADARALGVFDKPGIDRARAAEQRRIGYGAGASGFFEVAAFSGMTLIAGSISALVVAAYAVVMNIISFVFMVPLGLAAATGVLVARAYGARRPVELNRVAAIGFAVTALFGVVAGLAVWPASRLIALAFTSDPATVAMAAGGLALACLFLLPDALQVVIAQCLRARSDVVVPTMTHMASYVLVMLPTAWLLAIRLQMGVAGIVWAITIASFLSAGLLLGRFRMLARRD
jgi:MATE family multidrug resistance protein